MKSNRIEIITALIVTALVVNACAEISRSDDGARNEHARRVWSDHMTVIDRSVDFWKRRQPGSAPYSSEELTKAIEFFETLTLIKGANLSFIGAIPDESLESMRTKWKAWYDAHADELTYDSTGRVLLTR